MPCHQQLPSVFADGFKTCREWQVESLVAEVAALRKDMHSTSANSWLSLAEFTSSFLSVSNAVL